MLAKIVSAMACFYIILGIGFLVAGEAAGAPVTVLSIIWLEYRSRKKKKAKSGEKTDTVLTYSEKAALASSRCPYCGAEHESDFAFCESCGRKLS